MTEAKSPEEITRLKLSWLADPCWDIEDSEGFEAHREELKKYRIETEAHWQKERVRKLKDKAEQLGVPGNIKLAAYIESLESRLAALEAAARD